MSKKVILKIDENEYGFFIYNCVGVEGYLHNDLKFHTSMVTGHNEYGDEEFAYLATYEEAFNLMVLYLKQMEHYNEVVR